MTAQEAAQEKANEHASKKRQGFLTKFVILIALVFFGYFGVKYLQMKKAQRAAAQAQAEKYDNVETEIFDLSDEYKDQPADHDLPDMTVNELREKGAEFIYQMLLKNQVQINDMRQQIVELKAELTRYRNQEKIGRMIFTYVDLRQKIYAGKPHEDSLKNFEMLSVSDEFLQSKIAKLKTLLPDFSDHESLVKNFDALIPELIATKTNDPNAGWLAKVRHNLSKLIVVRKIDGKNIGDVDSVIAKTEKLLEEENYQEALNNLLTLDQNYHQILSGFLTELNTAVELQKIDMEILNYLKTLS